MSTSPKNNRSNEMAAIIILIITVFALNYLFASLCEPRSLWFMRDIAGLNVGKECRR